MYKAKDIAQNESICSESAIKKIYLKYRESFKSNRSNLNSFREEVPRSIATFLINYLTGTNHVRVERVG